MNNFTLASLRAYIDKMLSEHPERADYNIEIWNLMIARPPVHLTHDDTAKTVILVGQPIR